VDTQGQPDGMNAHAGCGTHPDARIALTRAVTEAAQSRLTWIQGGREDLPDFKPPKGRQPPETWSGKSDTISFDDIASYEHSSVNEDVEFIIEQMTQSGFEQIVAFDMTCAEVGIPVVRVVVPRAEIWTLYLQHGDRASLGGRALQEIR
jgi:ribosomal protein S12 methylthiotransferase accessory factor